LSLINHAHAAAANPAEYAVMGNCLPHGLGRSGHWLAMVGGTDKKVNCSAIPQKRKHSFRDDLFHDESDPHVSRLPLHHTRSRTISNTTAAWIDCGSAKTRTGQTNSRLSTSGSFR